MITEIDSPEKAAAYVVANIADLRFEQIGEIEKAVKRLWRGYVVGRIFYEDVTVTILYGARINQSNHKTTNPTPHHATY